MVKTKGPVASLDAAGKLAGALIFQKSGKRSTARKLTRPAQPRTGKQIGQRAMTAFISSQWAALSTADKATWATIAAINELPTYQAYLKENLRRWALFKRPSKVYPITETGSGGAPTVLTAVARLRTIQIGVLVIVPADNWGATIHTEHSAGLTPTHDNAIHALFTDTPAIHYWVHGPLEPGEYYYKAVSFSDDGAVGSTSAEAHKTIT